MKNTFRLLGLHLLGLFLLPLLAALMGLGLTSCVSSESPEVTLTRLANVGLTAGVLSGRITPAQADLVRKHGALILAASDGPAKVAAISNAALDAATQAGKLTPEQVEVLRAAGTVPLAPAAVDLPAIDVTSGK